ncbi:MAG: M48 family metallopeptidase [Pseudohongiellaceae bacterium]
MDFFESQEVARRNTLKLVLLFLLAIISLVAITNVLVVLILGFTQADPASGAPLAAEPAELLQRLDWRVFAWISLAVVGVVGLGSLYKISSLSGGGARVAEMMQARLLVTGSNDPDERKVLNVVEEMAIASGTPVPPVYVMEEDAINAFAAGYSPSDAVIGVTRGAIRKLSRDELQGVIAHEFSHILHGDMRLNIRLIGILYGIMVLGFMGYYLMRSAAFSRRSRNGGQIIFLGLGLVVIGFAGTFFGNLIKSAVSRQREYLADASAVQYTRNPQGIAGALKRIGADSQGSVLENPGASEISHALFGNGVKSGFNAMFATHPPLKKRIQRIQPSWDGSFDVVEEPQHSADQPAPADSGGGQRRDATLAVLAGVAMGRMGNPGPDELAYARRLHARLPGVLLEAAHQPWAARALVYRLQLADSESVRQAQLLHLQRKADNGVYEEVTALLQAADPEPEQRLVLVNIALSALRQLSLPQYRLFMENLRVLESLDSEAGLERWAVQRIVTHELGSVFSKAGRAHGRLKLKSVNDEVAVLLSWLAHAGEEARDADAAFNEAVAQLGVMGLTRLPPEALSLEQLDEAMERLSRMKPLLKPRLLKACAAGIAADGVATASEQALFRAVAEIIDCPMPPLDVSSSGEAQA